MFEECVVCAECGIEYVVIGENMSVTDTENEAKREGWKFLFYDGLHIAYCPSCQ